MKQNLYRLATASEYLISSLIFSVYRALQAIKLKFSTEMKLGLRRVQLVHNIVAALHVQVYDSSMHASGFF